MREIYELPEHQEQDFDMVFDALSIYRHPSAYDYTLSEASAIWRGMRKSLIETRGYTEEDLAVLQIRAAYILDGIGAMERDLRN